jgi:glycosyltransferase involved in cell wall biosynthesis
MAAELTVIVPAFNEEGRLAKTVREVFQAAQRTLEAFEIIIVNDGSRDRTGKVADSLARQYRWVSAVHQPFNLGVGAAYYRGLCLARYPYLTLVPGDNAFCPSGLEAVFRLVGVRDMVISYRVNSEARTPLRRLLSRCCTGAMRLLTGCKIQDAHSLFVFPVRQARQVRMNPGYGYHIETLSTLLRGGLSYVEVPVRLNPRPDASSKVMRPGVLARLILTLARLYVRYLLLRKKVLFQETDSSFRLVQALSKAG